MMNVPEIKPAPCPFCGCIDINIGVDMQGWAFAGCSACEARGPTIRPRLKCRPDRYDENEAIKAWNQRHA